jgi:hypothetical protein
LVGRLSDQKSVGKAPVVDPDLDTLIVLEGEVVDNPA